MSAASTAELPSSTPPRVSGIRPANLPVVVLTDDDVEQARELAEGRNESYVRDLDGGTNHGHSSLDAHVIGVLGEMAVAQFYDAEIDDEVHDYGDDGSDLTVNGIEVDVKTRTRNPPIMYSKAEKVDETALKNYYLVEQLDTHIYRLWGYVTAQQLADAPVMSWPHEENHVVTGYSDFESPYRPLD